VVLYNSDFEGLSAITKAFEPSGSQGGKLVIPLGNHMKSSAWQATSILDAAWWIWPGKLFGQYGWPVRHM